MQASKTKFYKKKIKVETMFDKVCYNSIEEFLGIKSLLLQTERSRLR